MHTSDSLQGSIAEQAVELIIKADSMAMADSINTALLIKQLEGLRNSERSKRQEIERELEQIRIKDSLLQAQMLDEIGRLKENAIEYPIKVHKDTLFRVYTKLGSLTPHERANVLTERLNNLYREFMVKSDSLILVPMGQSVDVYFKDRIIFTITELDALWYENDKMIIAQDFSDRIVTDIAKFKKDRSLLKILKGIGLVVLVILILIILIRGLNYLFRARINKFIWDKRGVWFKGIKIRNNELINQNNQTAAILFILKLFRYALIFLFIYLALPILFSIFPITRRLAETLFGYILNPLENVGRAFLDYIPSLITIAVIVVITRYILRFIKFLSTEIEKDYFFLTSFFGF